MRIAHVIDSLDPAHGGPSVVCASLAAAQAALGHQVRIISYDTPAASQQIRDMLAATPHGDSVDLVWITRPPPGIGAVLAADARRRLPNALAGMDLAVLHGVWDRILLAAASASNRASLRYALIPHGMLRPWSLSQSRFKKRLALLLATRRMLNRAVFLHALNTDEAAAFAALNLRPPVEVIPNGVFLEQLEPPPSPGAFHAAHPALRGRPYILFLSRLHFTKGLEFLADAFAIVTKSHPNVSLVVAGPDGGRRESFLAEIARTPFADRVYLPGPLYGPDKVAAFADARCFCLPSRTEGFSIAILESLACRCPAVISENCHFPQVGQAGAGAVVPLDPAAIAAAITTYLSGPARDAAGRAGRALVESAYTWSRIANRTLDLYARYAKPPTR